MGRYGGSGKGRLVLAAGIVLISLATYFWNSSENPVTGEKERVALSPDQEIALGLQTAPEIAAQFGGEVRDPKANALVDRVGAELLAGLEKTLAEQGRKNPYPFEFHLLADDETVNAFALPGGQVFITAALFQQFETEGQLAMVLGHEIGHVLSRHGAERMAKQNLSVGLVSATGVAADDQRAMMAAQAAASMINMKYGRNDEFESDRWGVRLAYAAGYDPQAIFGVMKILENAGGGGSAPEFLSTHPKPANRVEYAKQVLAEEFPNGVPTGLKP
ncbi:MAG: M48 family metalloprotease [Planctomycetaceae bacterium]|nr:M48 family metalloprotease [Planctomycetaceae bacterium]